MIALSLRLVNLRQPLLENFIDRQVQTAMMARNLARDGSMLYPEVDTGPFPAYYMLEFPGYPALAATVAATTGLALDTAGRLVSAVAMALACLLFFDLVRRHDGLAVGVVAGAVLALMPVTVRYGRAFQPDSMMFTLLIAAVWAMDRWAQPVLVRIGSEPHGQRWSFLLIATLATTGAVLLKVISAYVLIPLAYLAWTRYRRASLRRWELWLALLLIVLPSLAWYVHAWKVASGTTNVTTPCWHVHKWIALGRLLDLPTYRQLAYYLGLRVLTPVGVVLALIGALLRASRLGTEDRGSRTLLFHVWLASLATYFPILVRKLDHEHYYLALAPVAAVFIARALVSISAAPLAGRFYVTGPVAASVLAVALLGSDLLACASTYRTPTEWQHVPAAAAAVRECTPPSARVVGHSSVLFYADRRGWNMVYRPQEVSFLFETWGRQPTDPTPGTLLEFYRSQDTDYLVELLGTARERSHAEFIDFVRDRYRVIREVPGKYSVAARRD
ncbi:MAG: glycosyltransferase family 39 protein [Planctomycetes bacterium]|nr:glycosyltransferase family 39 protein [Planctomycetota bacterium]